MHIVSRSIFNYLQSWDLSISDPFLYYILKEVAVDGKYQFARFKKAKRNTNSIVLPVSVFLFGILTLVLDCLHKLNMVSLNKDQQYSEVIHGTG